MTIYIDPTRLVFRTRVSRLYGDTIAELHEFARGLGIQQGWFAHEARPPYYELYERKRDEAIMRGALPVTLGQLHTIAKRQSAAWAIEYMEARAHGRRHP